MGGGYNGAAGGFPRSAPRHRCKGHEEEDTGGVDDLGSIELDKGEVSESMTALLINAHGMADLATLGDAIDVRFA